MVKPVGREGERIHKVLIADDNRLIRAMLADLLEKNGCEVHQAENGKQALEMALSSSYELIFSDIIMPGMDGLELLRELRKGAKDSSVIVITASPHLDTAIEALRLGAEDYIRKPFDERELLASVRKAVERSRIKTLTHEYQNTLEERVFAQEDRIRFLFYEAMQSLIYAIEAKDPYTRGHSMRVTSYSTWLVKELGLPFEKAADVHMAARLHDIGKLSVPDSILNKKDQLSDEEFTVIKQHPERGCKILTPIIPREALETVLHHHERWDGGGYPIGSSMEAIPVGARVITLADAFDAMTSDRPYRGKWDMETALDEIRSCTGTQFDPDLVPAFVSAMESNFRATEVVQ